MGLIFSDQARLLFLVIGCAVLWSLEAVVPLYKFKRPRLRHALPNILLTMLLVATNLALSFVTAGVAAFASNKRLGVFFFVAVPAWLIWLLGVLVLDLFAYVAHVLLHKSSLGWQFHRVHHSESEVNVTTAFRQHPGETVWRILWQIMAVAIFGIPMWVVLVYLTISTLNAQLEHTNIRVRKFADNLLRLIVVTPNMHKVHHSRFQFQTDSNYSNIFSFWDRLFGTYTSAVDFAQLRYGLDGFDERQTFGELLCLPFKRIDVA
jgi:sterol desaturase/sphingolipid hydroxylase (fatty acid hydroxylase superfamily)